MEKQNNAQLVYTTRQKLSKEQIKSLKAAKQKDINDRKIVRK